MQEVATAGEIGSERLWGGRDPVVQVLLQRRVRIGEGVKGVVDNSFRQLVGLDGLLDPCQFSVEIDEASLPQGGDEAGAVRKVFVGRSTYIGYGHRQGRKGAQRASATAR